MVLHIVIGKVHAIPCCHDLVPHGLERNLPMLGQVGGVKMVSNMSCSF